MDAELQLLQGTWQAVNMEAGGGPVPPEAARRLKYVFAGDRVTLLEDDVATGAGAVAVRPGAIDVAMTDGPGRGQVARGIYEVAGDRLRLCIGPERPAAFRGVGSASLVELERVPPGPGSA
jgi:uncharacterized protein (TIGR03067 family)